MKITRLLSPTHYLAATLLLSALVIEGRSQSAKSSATPAPKSDWAAQFKPKLADAPRPPLGSAPATPAPKPRLTYTLQRAENPTPEELAAYERITAGMDKAARFYNEYTTGVEKNVRVHYNPGVPTADGNINGSIRFGKNAHNARVCMHEICHTVGVGTSPHWGKLVVDKVFTGRNATETLRELTGDKSAVVHADRMHFWPYGLNFDNEVKSDEDLIRHCKMVAAIYKDLKDAAK